MTDYLLPYNLQYFADGPGGEKTEEATAKKKEDTRKEGKVAKSKEISNALVLISLFLTLKFFSGFLANRFDDVFRWCYGLIPDFVSTNAKAISIPEIHYIIFRGLVYVLLCTVPFLAVSFVVSVAANIFQFDFRVTTKPMEPSLDKFNPINGFKRMFSKQQLFELGKSIAKIILIFVVAYNCIKGESENLLLLYDIPLMSAVSLVGQIIIDVGLRISLVYILIAAIDFFYQRHKFNEDIKMTKQEVKDEYKDAEGDPVIKGRQKQRMMEASRRRMMKEVPNADVVITNPTHIAVALRYSPPEDSAPVVVAIGYDLVALRIREIAKENNVTIVENKMLARSLAASGVDVGDTIPPDLYEAVAAILANLAKFQNFGAA